MGFYINYRTNIKIKNKSGILDNKTIVFIELKK